MTVTMTDRLSDRPSGTDTITQAKQFFYEEIELSYVASRVLYESAFIRAVNMFRHAKKTVFSKVSILRLRSPYKGLPKNHIYLTDALSKATFRTSTSGLYNLSQSLDSVTHCRASD